MKKIAILFLLALLQFSAISSSKPKLNILIVTGGHEFEREAFFKMFDSFENIGYKALEHPNVFSYLQAVDFSTFDAVVFYDMPKSINEDEKKVYDKLVENGKGLLFLHHSIAAYQDWSEYKTFIGGKYYETKKDDLFGASSYQHDVNFTVKFDPKPHPVTKGLKDFEMTDEIYGNLEVLDNVRPLLTTDHPKSNKLIGWTFENSKSKIVYIQPGHDHLSWENPNYRQLIKQAIKFVAGK